MTVVISLPTLPALHIPTAAEYAQINTAITNIAGLGQIGESVNSTSNVTFTTTETAGPTYTLTATAAEQYEIRAGFAWESSTSGDIMIFRLRYKNAGSLSAPPSADTQLTLMQVKAPAAGNPIPMYLARTVTGLSGTYTFGVTGIRSAGSGTCQMNGAAANNSVIVLQIFRIS